MEEMSQSVYISVHDSQATATCRPDNRFQSSDNVPASNSSLRVDTIINGTAVTCTDGNGKLIQHLYHR